jgi:hypothetical protein
MYSLQKASNYDKKTRGRTPTRRGPPGVLIIRNRAASGGVDLVPENQHGSLGQAN